MKKLSREYVVALLAVALIFAAVGAVYQFYYKQRLAQYAEDNEMLKSLDAALKSLEEKFEKKVPEDLIKAQNGLVQPLAEQVVQRAAFFNTADLLQIDPIPEGKLPRFYYAEQFNKLLNDLRQEALSHTPYCSYPDASTFGAPRPEDLEGRTVSNQEVKQWLTLIKFGCSMVRMLMNAKAVAIYDVQIWPVRPGYDNLLLMRTVGLSFVMRYSDLVAWIDKLRLENRYFDVGGIAVQNRYLRWAVEPPVEVQVLLTQADFNPASATAPTRVAAAPAGLPGPVPGGPLAAMAARGPFPGMTDAQRLAQGGFQRTGRQALAPPTRWEKTRRWLRNHYLWPF